MDVMGQRKDADSPRAGGRGEEWFVADPLVAPSTAPNDIGFKAP